MHTGRSHSGEPAPKRLRVQGVHRDISQALMDRSATEPQLLNFRRTGKSLNLSLLYAGAAYAGYFALNARANEELHAGSTGRCACVTERACSVNVHVLCVHVISAMLQHGYGGPS